MHLKTLIFSLKKKSREKKDNPFRISGGMASTKDLAGHVTANMRKHLAKQKWKVIIRIHTDGFESSCSSF